jgi:3-hydroxyacyl-CoA dehydrogenase/enoyl-CoA hydratase/3-hydroxybutyryl-CoA epimerase
MDMNLQHLKVVEHPAGATLVDLDVRDKRLNVLSEEVFADLNFVIRDLAKSPKERPIFLRSGKEKGFVVGADLRRLKELTEPEAVDRFLKKGQETMQAWVQLPNPTVAWVKGMALGGGLELALSCKYLLVSQGPNVQLGLPETKLGLLPGWGGTQLLPRRIGFEAALTMLLTGEPIDENRALALGLVDGTWSTDSESAELESWIEAIQQKQGQSLPKRPTHTELRAERARFDENLPPWSQLLGETVEEDIVRARRAILSAVFTGLEKGIEAGMDEERAQFCPLVSDPKVQARLDRFAPKK